MVQLRIIFIVKDREVLQQHSYNQGEMLLHTPYCHSHHPTTPLITPPLISLTNNDIEKDKGHENVIGKEIEDSTKHITTCAHLF